MYGYGNLRSSSSHLSVGVGVILGVEYMLVAGIGVIWSVVFVLVACGSVL